LNPQSCASQAAGFGVHAGGDCGAEPGDAAVAIDGAGVTVRSVGEWALSFSECDVSGAVCDALLWGVRGVVQ